MKKHNQGRKSFEGSLVGRGLLASFKRTLKMFRRDSTPILVSSVTTQILSDAVLSFDELRKIDSHLLIMEKQKVEAIRLVRDRNYII
jgi:hypothetical protein